MRYTSSASSRNKTATTSKPIDLSVRAIARNPRAADYHNNLGNTYRLQGDLARAIATYRQAIALDPQSHRCFIASRILLADQGNFAEAEKIFSRLLQFNPTIPMLTIISPTRN